MNLQPYFDTNDDKKFCYVVVGTGLNECALACSFARLSKRVLQIDENEFYGGVDGTLSLKEFRQFVEDTSPKVAGGVDAVVVDATLWNVLSEKERQFSIDISIPCLFYSKSRSVDELVNHDVAKYMSFHSVRSIRVHEWEIPTTRNKIFADKSLTLREKRSLMSLLKSVVSSTSLSVYSTTLVGMGDTLNRKAEESVLTNPSSETRAVEYLKSFNIDRPELIAGLINGVCLYPLNCASMPASLLIERLALFISSTGVYEEGSALLVPSYGNGDICQAFARAAAVNGAVQILGCDMTRLKDELGSESSDSRPPPVWIDRDTWTNRNAASTALYPVIRGVIITKSNDPDSSMSLKVLPVVEDNRESTGPIFILSYLPTNGFTVHQCWQYLDSSLTPASVESFNSQVCSFLGVHGEIAFQATFTTTASIDAHSVDHRLDEITSLVHSLDT